MLVVERRYLCVVCGCRVKELEAAAPVLDNKPTDVPAPNDTPLRKQSSDLAVLRTTNVSDGVL